MDHQPDEQITRILNAMDRGDRHDAEALLPLLYDELRRLAGSKMRQEQPGQTLQPTALVHEAYLRLVGGRDPGWESRGHFFAAAATAMRRILLEAARRKARIKHGGEFQRVDMNESLLPIEQPRENIVALDEALQRLEQDDPRLGQIVNLRYFAGLTTEETAAALGVSVSTIEREWRYARRWLFNELSEPPADQS